MHALHNQKLIRAAVPSYLQTRLSIFSDRSSLYRAAATSLRDTKLQKKLARDATVRKQAENALRSADALHAVDLIGLNETTSEEDRTTLTPEDDPQDTAELPPDTATTVQSQPSYQPTLNVPVAPRGPRQRRPFASLPASLPEINTAPLSISNRARGRSRPGSARGAQTHSQGPRRGSSRGRSDTDRTSRITSDISGRPTDRIPLVDSETEAGNSGVSIMAVVQGTSDSQSVTIPLAGPSQQVDSELNTEAQAAPTRKRRKVATADPVAAASREAELRNIFS